MERRDVLIAAGAAVLSAGEAKAATPEAQVRLVKLRFKPGGKQPWLDWSKELERRKAEVIATLKNEGVSSEACFLSEDGAYVYYFMEVADYAKAQTAFAKSRFKIDSDHARVKGASLEKVADLQPLFAFQNRS